MHGDDPVGICPHTQIRSHAAHTELDKQEQRIAEQRTELKIEHAAALAEIEELLALSQEWNTNGSIAPVPLTFDDSKRTISWVNGEVKLGKKPYRFVQQTTDLFRRDEIALFQHASPVPEK